MQKKEHVPKSIIQSLDIHKYNKNKFMTSSKIQINFYNLLMTRNNTYEYGTMLPRPI